MNVRDLLSEKVFSRLNVAYRKAWGMPLCACDADGAILYGRPACAKGDEQECAQCRTFAISEAKRWGEPTIVYCHGRRLVWAAPLMFNERVLGGVVVSAAEKKVFTPLDNGSMPDLRRACSDLRELLEKENLLNCSALNLARREYQEEQRRAYALHDAKAVGRGSVRELYMREEPELFAAIRAGDRNAARGILNRVLVLAYGYSGNNIQMLKSFFLELLVSMCRTAVESGGDADELLGANFAVMTALSHISNDEELTVWLKETFERIFDSIQRGRKQDAGRGLFDALDYMERHCCEDITRDDAARAAHLSPPYFSSLLRKESGSTFTELLNRMRVDKAAQMLLATDRPLSIIALEAGFHDQSYFTKVFKRYRKITPLEFRQQHK